MSCEKCRDYPLLEESAQFFDDVFEEWHASMDEEKTRLATLSKMRDWRRKAIEVYYF